MKRPVRIVSYFSIPGGARANTTRSRIDAATRTLQTHARRRGWVLIEPFLDLDPQRGRPELGNALTRCRETEARLLVPRFAELGGDLRFLDPVVESSVRIVCAERGPIPASTLRLLVDVARHGQREASERSRAALGAARDRGVRLGSPRPEVGSRAGVAALRSQANAHAEATAPILLELLLSNPDASLRDLAALLDELEVPTPRSGRWGPSAVRNSLERAGLGGVRETLRSAEGKRGPRRNL